jgi:hypothetical protein
MKTRKKTMIYASIIMCILLVFFVSNSLAIFKTQAAANTEVPLATWNVSLTPDADDDLVVIPGVSEDTYTLSVTNQSQVDIRYSIILSNLPNGVEVAVGDGAYQPVSNNTVSFADVGVILFNDSTQTKSHVIHIRGGSNPTYVTAQTVNVSVLVKQVV